MKTIVHPDGSTIGTALSKDVFFRSHVVKLKSKKPLVSTYNEPQWPEYALVFDTETTLDPQQQSLLFGFYRVCRLHENRYECVEEGILHADDPEPRDKDLIDAFARGSQSEVTSSDYDENIHIYSRSDFVEKVFFEAVRTRSLIVAFNAPFDISRLSIGYRKSRNRAWTLIMAERESRKTGEIEPNPERPGVRVTSRTPRLGSTV